MSLCGHQPLQIRHTAQRSFIAPHRVVDFPFAERTAVGESAQSLLQSVPGLFVRRSITLSQSGQHVFEPALLSDQSDDPGLRADTASQSLKGQPPELRRLVPALLPKRTQGNRTGTGAGGEGPAKEPERGGEEAPLTGFN